jgi:hypothetical protein
MRGLPFPTNAIFDREPSYADYGTPFTNVEDNIPIDPALGGPAIDPAIMNEAEVEANAQVSRGGRILGYLSCKPDRVAASLKRGYSDLNPSIIL